MIAQTVADLEDNLKRTESALQEVTAERDRIASQLDAKEVELADMRGLYKRYQEDRDDAVEVAVTLETQFETFATQMGHVAENMAALVVRLKAAKDKRKEERGNKKEPLSKLVDELSDLGR